MYECIGRGVQDFFVFWSDTKGAKGLVRNACSGRRKEKDGRGGWNGFIGCLCQYCIVWEFFVVLFCFFDI